MFPAQTGTLSNTRDIDTLRQWALQTFKKDIEGRSCLHMYVKNLPTETQKLIDKLRYSPQIINAIRSKVVGCDLKQIKALSSSDELYISHYNNDNGGDQGLFFQHYDGSLRGMKNVTVVRSLIYINANDKYVVKFLDTGMKHNFKTNEFGLLDFHNELHEVEGEYNPNDTPRMLLKCQYFICTKCNPLYEKYIVLLNLYIFYIVKYCMEYSKSPTTLSQKLVGWICNVMRVLNMLSPLLPIVFIVSAIVIVTLLPWLIRDVILLFDKR